MAYRLSDVFIRIQEKRQTLSDCSVIDLSG